MRPSAAVMEIILTVMVNGMGDCDHSAMVRFHTKLAQFEANSNLNRSSNRA